jgi:hypothetical protein
MNANTNEPDLESRINARCMEMARKLDELEGDTCIEAVQTRDRLEAKLSELRHIIIDGMVDGWARLDEQVGVELDRWLAESASQLRRLDERQAV